LTTLVLNDAGDRLSRSSYRSLPSISAWHLDLVGLSVIGLPQPNGLGGIDDAAALRSLVGV